MSTTSSIVISDSSFTRFQLQYSNGGRINPSCTNLKPGEVSDNFVLKGADADKSYDRTSASHYGAEIVEQRPSFTDKRIAIASHKQQRSQYLFSIIITPTSVTIVPISMTERCAVSL